MNGLLLVLVEWQPAQPLGEDLVDVGTLWPKPHHFPNSRDAVLSGFDILLGARLSHLDHSYQHVDGHWVEEATREWTKSNINGKK